MNKKIFGIKNAITEGERYILLKDSNELFRVHVSLNELLCSCLVD